MTLKHLGIATMFAGAATASVARTAMAVAKDPNCGCYAAWAAIMEQSGAVRGTFLAATGAAA